LGVQATATQAEPSPPRHQKGPTKAFPPHRLSPCLHRCPKNDILRIRQICIWRSTVAEMKMWEISAFHPHARAKKLARAAKRLVYSLTPSGVLAENHPKNRGFVGILRGQECLRRRFSRRSPVGEWSRGARSMPRVCGRVAAVSQCQSSRRAAARIDSTCRDHVTPRMRQQRSRYVGAKRQLTAWPQCCRFSVILDDCARPMRRAFYFRPISAGPYRLGISTIRQAGNPLGDDAVLRQR